MDGIPTYQARMKDTRVAMHKRSPKLKELDLAIKAQPQSKEAVKKALDAWRFDQLLQGKNWRKSSRNKKGALTALARAINPDKRRLSAEEIEALKNIARAQSIGQHQFDTKQVKFKSHTMIGMLSDGGPSYGKIKATLRDGSFVETIMKGKGTVKGAQNIGALNKVGGIVRDAGIAKHICGARGKTVKDFEGKIMKVLKQAAEKNDPIEIFKIGNINVTPRELATKSSSSDRNCDVWCEMHQSLDRCGEESLSKTQLY